ncbi:MAG TPA: multifunctional CCA addition/repair protein [Methylophilaceae bacterium]|nr:multifunctional CCA addition/repair protein [Methylophilaceae bacterium]HQC27836.1 multifunctional CCA addition/repair protein [Methylotenera sp.]
MQIYLVGGAVRDELLGSAVTDRDYVVVGSCVDEMLAAGFRPVGKDFPVFLHPKTQDEYALARTERKVASGYKGFTIHAATDVTLEEDLGRRDLTINAMAKTSDGQLIDPYGGLADIQSKTLRHVSAAFAEDPVRILRIARFAARYADFSVAPETNALMQQMVDAGEVDALVAERVWQELSKGLMEVKPSRMFEVLRSCGALKKLLPELDRLWGVPQPAKYHPEIDTGVHVMMVIDYAASKDFSLPVRFAALMHDLGKGTTPKEMLPRHIGHEARSVSLLKEITKRLRVPTDCKELAQMVAKYHGKLHAVEEMRPSTLLSFLIELDAIRQPERLKLFLQACEADSRGRTGFEERAQPEAIRLLSALDVASSIDAGAVARGIETPEKIKTAVFEARLAAIQSKLKFL